MSAKMSKKKPKLKRSKLATWFSEQKITAKESFSELLRQPMTLVATCSVIALSLVLPVILTVVNNSVSKIAEQLDPSDEISLYLNEASTERAKKVFEKKLEQNNKVLGFWRVSPQEGIIALEQWAGIGEVLEFLDENPLPTVIVVRPLPDMGVNGLEALVQELEKSPLVDHARLDFEWVGRVQEMSIFFKHLVTTLWLFLSLGVVLITGNSIRMIIESRRQEIIIVKMVGGTNSFVSRPFLYTGFWVGLLAGFLAWILIQISFIILSDATQNVVSLYDSNFQVMENLGLKGNLYLFAGSSFLGYLGALLAVKRNIAKIEPQ